MQMSRALLEKLYNIGVISSQESLAKLAGGEKRISVSWFCRRRLATVLVKLKYCERLKQAVTFIEKGHVRVGPETITDPAYLVTRNMENFITWVDESKIKRKVLAYNDQLDDYDVMA
uniref:U3 small nucleolar ribonucleoprotein protein IMP3-like n=1 Tax=Erigeron canadensis TaxID=72917 RepID=UPI001CB993BB|nr:U3 small nucleolar ribonucleoprotein protein IMP3-like [Erigeron canadensis]